jgi:hypothetical protein
VHRRIGNFQAALWIDGRLFLFVHVFAKHYAAQYLELNAANQIALACCRI